MAVNDEVGSQKAENGGSRPVPDPTILTTQQLTREIAAVRDYINGQIQVIHQQLVGNDRATDLRLEASSHISNEIDVKVAHLGDIVNEKFTAVDQQFDDRTIWLEEKYGSIAQQFVERDTRSERECVTADTPILCADLTWRPAGDLLPGDELVAFEEHLGSEAPVAGRRFERSVVTANSLKQDDLVRLNMSDGYLRCNRRHPLLTRSRHGEGWRWRKAGDLKPGMSVMKVFEPWEVDRSWAAGWLAGILDGEGSLHVGTSPKIVVAQTEGAVADQIALELGERCSAKEYRREAGTYTRFGAADDGSDIVRAAKAQRRWQIGVREDVLRLLGTVRPVRLLEKSDAVWEGRRVRAGRGGSGSTVMSVEDAGVGTIAMLSTSSATYVAGGYASHNSRDNKVAVDAAFAAQKEAASEQNKSNTLAITKSEVATTETINKLAELFKTTTDGLADKIDDQKDRLNRIETALATFAAQIGGHTQGGTDSRSNIAWGIAAVAGLFGIVATVLAILSAVRPPG